MEGKRNKEKYLEVWDEIILPAINDLIEIDGVGIFSKKKTKKAIWRAYKVFNRHCSLNYMKNSQAPLDRHKVAACYMFAIVEVSPFFINKDASLDHEVARVNEYLAVNVGCAVLSSFLKTIVNKMKDPELVVEIENSLKNGFPLDFSVSHGEYLLNLMDALHLTRIEKRYNIPLLAILVFHWESSVVSKRGYEAISRYLHERSE